ncbi:MAG: hypothetical protein COS89_04615 [Deltaproteobacteria bacterium CG07_land_8_20_14_0_80_38_7]|nr:MAG: hypothetical protein COS89_04615 [Deltaproteobacteria bacterium CG07_land_8_20_14_0_80_38_7]
MGFSTLVSLAGLVGLAALGAAGCLPSFNSSVGATSRGIEIRRTPNAAGFDYSGYCDSPNPNSCDSYIQRRISSDFQSICSYSNPRIHWSGNSFSTRVMCTNPMDFGRLGN